MGRYGSGVPEVWSARSMECQKYGFSILCGVEKLLKQLRQNTDLCCSFILVDSITSLLQ